MVPEPNAQFLLVMSPNEFERISAAAETAPGVSPRDLRIYLRQLHSRAQHGASDKQGRLLLPDDLCKQLDLKGEVALVGGRGRGVKRKQQPGQIWAPPETTTKQKDWSVVAAALKSGTCSGANWLTPRNIPLTNM